VAVTRVGRDSAEWHHASVPTDADLVSVTTTRTGAVAVGEGGTVVRRDRTRDDWTTLVGVGPTAAGNDLTGVAATDCGRRVWFVGGSGALGSYDLASGRKHDYTAPMEKTSTWEAVAVAGDAGAERLLFANGSGELLAARLGDSGAPVWGAPVKPGGGSTITAVALGPLGGVACDTSGNVFRVAGGDWQRIGVRNAEVDFFDAVVARDRVWVAGDDGLCYRYDPGRDNWTPVAVGEETLRGLARDRTSGATDAGSPERDRLAVVGDSGTLAWHTPTVGWHAVEGLTDEDLRAVALGPVDAAVGDTVLERVTPRGGTAERRPPGGRR
jgi:hypothetical protein